MKRHDANAETPRQQPAHELSLIVDGSNRYLYNGTSRDIARLECETHALWDTDRGLVVTDTPIYEIADIPAGAHLVLDMIDRFEDGVVVWYVRNVEWADGSKESTRRRLPVYHVHNPRPLPDLPKGSGPTIPGPRVERAVVRIGVRPGYRVTDDDTATEPTE